MTNKETDKKTERKTDGKERRLELQLEDGKSLLVSGNSAFSRKNREKSDSHRLHLQNNKMFVPLKIHFLLLLLPLTAAATTPTTTATQTPTNVTSPAPPGNDLTGKMFTLSRSSASVSFYPSTHTFSLGSAHMNSANMEWTRPTWTPPPWTTGSPTPSRADLVSGGGVSLFTLSPSSTPLEVAVSSSSQFTLTFNRYSGTSFSTPLMFLYDLPSSPWSSVCVTVSGTKNVVQVFNNQKMSIRRVLQNRFVWSGEPVLKFPGFDGQLSDVQVWDYPLSFMQVQEYMAFSRWSRGSILSWSSITYYVTGNALLETSFDVLQKKLPSAVVRKEKKKTKLLFISVGNKQVI